MKFTRMFVPLSVAFVVSFVGCSSEHDDLGKLPSEDESRQGSNEGVELAKLNSDDCYLADDFTCATERLIVEYTNEYRRRSGLPDLAFHGPLSWAARRWSETQAKEGRISHRGFPNVRMQDYRNEFKRVDISLTSENVAMFGGRAATTPESVARQLVTQWYNSSGHRAAMLSRRSTLLGAGVVVRNGRTAYGTQLFAVPAN